MISWDHEFDEWLNPQLYALNVQNVTDKVYVSTCLGRGECWWSTRRTVIASVRFRFLSQT